MHHRLSLFALIAALLVGCAGPKETARPAEGPRTEPGSGQASPLLLAGDPGAASADAASPLPIYPEDARWGAAAAPVTVIAVIDLQCPFCARAENTLQELRRKYGPNQLRIVVKHNPLPFHANARPAALAALSVQRSAGDEAVFRFVSSVYHGQGELDGAKLAEWARQASSTGAPRAASLTADEQLARDIDFAEKTGARGTPTFFINGTLLPGAQPTENFVAIIDAELEAVGKARAAGQPTSYAARVAVNFETPPKSQPPESPEPEDVSVWKVPVGTSPVSGAADALVTIVEFSDYQCPFCKRVQPALQTLRTKYGNDVRFVFKHTPLPFHPRARPAAEMAVEAYREKGNAGFWDADKALFAASAEELSDEGLLAIAGKLGLDVRKVKTALTRNVHDAAIETDLELAADVQARGTPHFFVNGRRLAGAQPLDAFVRLVDEQLTFARALVAKGVPRNKIYDTILEHAEGPPAPVKVDLGAPLPDRATRGPRGAVVVIHEFSDFQCPFCKRAGPTLADLQKEFPRDVKVVWHNLPLAFHDRAVPAANAALEARARGGDAAFWKFHDLLFQDQQDLSDAKLADLGKAAGVSRDAILAAIHEGRYAASIAEDQALAERAGIRGTPGFLVDGYVVSGARPLSEFRRAVRRALADRASPAKPAPAQAPLAPVAPGTDAAAHP